MLSWLWWLPLVVAAAAVVPCWRGARRLAVEAAALQASISELQAVRPLVAEVKAEIGAVAAGHAAVTAAGHAAATAAGHAAARSGDGRAVHYLAPR